MELKESDVKESLLQHIQVGADNKKKKILVYSPGCGGYMLYLNSKPIWLTYEKNIKYAVALYNKI